MENDTQTARGPISRAGIPPEGAARDRHAGVTEDEIPRAEVPSAEIARAEIETAAISGSTDPRPGFSRPADSRSQIPKPQVPKPRIAKPGRSVACGAVEHDALEPSTLTLWRRCAHGGCDADWCELHQRLAGRIHSWLQRGVSGPCGQLAALEADDLAQEVYCRLLANDRRALRRCRAQSDGELMAYLARVCQSVLISAARERGACKRRAASGAPARCIDHDKVSAPGLSPEERALVADVRRKAIACTTRSCPVAARRQRFILDQVLFVGYTSGELSRSVGVSASSIDTVVSRARRRARSLGIPFPNRCGFDSSRRRHRRRRGLEGCAGGAGGPGAAGRRRGGGRPSGAGPSVPPRGQR